MSGPRLLALSAIALLMAATAYAAAPLDAWRDSVSQARILADNQAPQAYREAKRLQAAAPPEATAADRARILNLICRIEIYLALSDEAARHCETAFELARKNNDKIGQAEADLSIALNSVNQSKMDALVSAVTHSMTVLEGVDRPDLLAEAMLRTAMTYGRFGVFDASVTMPMQAMEIAQRSNSPRALAYAHQGMAISLNQAGHPAEAQQHYEQMRESARAARSKIMEASALVGIGDTLTAQGKLREGETYFREAIATHRAFGGPFFLAHGLFGLADNLRRQGQRPKALAILGEIIPIYERHENKIGLWWTLQTRSSDYLAMGRLSEAAADAERAYALAKDIGLALYLSKGARRLAATAAAQGDHQRAYALSAEAAEMADKAAQEHASTRITELAQRYRSEAKQREIEELQHRNEQQAVQQYWLWTVLGSSLAILAVTTYFLLRLRRSRREIQALNVGLEQRVQARTAELRQHARYLRTLIDMLPMWAWFKDTQNRYLVTNQSHAQACGRTVDEMIGKSDLDLVPGSLAQAHHADDVEVMASRRRKTTEELRPDGNGSQWMEVYKAAVADEDGTLLGTVGVARDISERKAAEEARNAALAEAERLAQARSDFLAQMSHELRTPLNGILGHTQILQRNPMLDQRQAAGLAVIRQSGEQLLTLLNDILDLAKIEAGKLEVQLNTIPLQRFLRTIVDIVAVRAEQKGLIFRFETPADLPMAVRGDERLLRQTLLNLLDNAIKFTDRGQVALRVSRKSPDRLRFAVEDTGIGIASEHLESIFRPFEQAGDRRQRIGGTGLGLAICRQFVDRMGGEIKLASQLGDGSVFWFDLDAPDACAKIEVLPNPVVVCGYEGPRKRILGVDDLPESRALIADMLEPLGFDVIQAADGYEAIEATRVLKPDLILIDTVMPRMDGYEATRHLRKLPGCETMPIIAISASASGLDRDNSLLMGASDFLAKPINLDALLDRIGVLLGITWIRREQAGQATSPGGADSLLVPPPHEEMEILHHLALQGNMRDILRHAGVLLELDERYHPFVHRLRELASGYQSKAILAMVEQHRDRNPRG